MAMTNSIKYSKNYQMDGTNKHLMNTKYCTKEQFYNTNVYNSVSNSGSYNFKEREGRLKWKDIVSLDIESMIRNNDITPLETYLANLIFSSVDENDLQIVPETSVLKLIKTYQYVLEYLLHTQQKLENENKVLETNYTQMVHEAMTKEGVLKDNKTIIKSLKKEKREKEMVLNTYKCVIDEYKTGKQEQAAKSYHYCKFCVGKRFSTEEALYEHHQRRHGLNQSNVSKGNNIDDKFDQMKTYFETYIKSFQNDSYLKIFEGQRNIEHKLEEVKHVRRNNDINDVENGFKSTLLEMKEFLMKSAIAGGNQEVVPNELDKKQYEQSLELIRQQAQQMNQILAKIEKDQDEKIQRVIEKFNVFSSGVAGEFGVLKEINHKENEEKKKKKADKKLQEQEKAKQKEAKSPKIKLVTTVAQVESIELKPSFKESQCISNHTSSVEPNTNQSIIIDRKRSKSPIRKKQFFNSGRVETDSSEDEDRTYSFMNKTNDMKQSKSRSDSSFRAKNTIIQNIENELGEAQNENITADTRITEPKIEKGKSKTPPKKKIVEPIEVEEWDDDNDIEMKIKVATKLNEPSNNKIIDKRLHEEKKERKH
jgi:hypothetical protein